ncbi:CU044_2847 family protein [Streptomyces sp. NPDC047123]|uniref:CU044_2847 family protein n=1 Tax=unclassified Streptomyces TaxID=2593676 RepID=UPI0033FA1CB3
MPEHTGERPPRAAILVEFQQRGGVRQVALNAPEAMAQSARAVDQAMETIRAMAERVRGTVARMDLRPDGVEVTFGIKFDTEAGAVIAKAGVEASVSVTLRWGAGGQT